MVDRGCHILVSDPLVMNCGVAARSSTKPYLTSCNLPVTVDIEIKGDARNMACDVPFATPLVGEFAGVVAFAGELAVRATISCTATYVLTAQDIDALEIISTTSVQAVDKSDAKVTDSTKRSTSLDQVGYNDGNAKYVYRTW